MKELKKNIKKSSKKGSKVNKPSKISISKALEDDQIIEYHFQGLSLREIGEKVSLSHVTVNQRLKKIIKEITKTQNEDTKSKIRLRVRELEFLIKKSWGFIGPKNTFSFKYIELILKIKQEISRLENLYPISKKEGKQGLEEVLKSLDASKSGYTENAEDEN